MISWSLIKNILKISGVGLFFFIVFVILTFPYGRLGPKISDQMEKILGSATGTRPTCHLDGFDLALPFGIKWSRLICADSFTPQLLEITDGHLTLLPKFQRLSGSIEKGHFSIVTNMGLSAAPSKVSGKFEKVPLKNLSPLISAFVSKASPAIRNLDFQGELTGEFDLPIQDLARSPGSLALDFQKLRLPSQPLLNLIGLKELAFSRSVLKANISSGRLTFSDSAFLSDHLSGKIEGYLESKSAEERPTVSITLKWKVQRSDALLSSPVGAMLANSPCPAKDSEDFCNKKITSFEELRTTPGLQLLALAFYQPQKR